MTQESNLVNMGFLMVAYRNMGEKQKCLKDCFITKDYTAQNLEILSTPTPTSGSST